MASLGPAPAPRTVAAVVALVALVAVASGGASVWAPSRSGVANRLEVLAIVAVVLGLGIVVATAIVLALHRTVTARGAEPPALRVVLLRAFPVTAVVLALTSLLVITTADLEPAAAGASDGAAVPTRSADRRGAPFGIDGLFDVMAGEGEPDAEGAGGTGSDPGRIPPLFILAGAVAIAVALALAAWWYARGRSPRWRTPGPEDADHDTAHGAVLETINAMLADPDPRTAIIGAYAMLLEGLSSSGGPRRDYEGPMEHLERVLAVLDVRPEPSRTLIELFEIARFSTHPLTASHRDRALEALREVAADLAGGATTPTAFPTGSGSRTGGSAP